MTQFKKYIDTFHGIMDLNVFGTAEQAILLAKTVQKINDTNNNIIFANKVYNANYVIAKRTSRKNITQETLKNWITKDKDISANEYNFGTLGNSGVVLLENTGLVGFHESQWRKTLLGEE